MRIQIVIRSRYGRVLTAVQVRHCLFEHRGIYVRIVRAAAIARPPAAVYRQVHQVRQPRPAPRSWGFASFELAERIQVYWLGTPGNEIRIDERRVTDLVVGVVVNVLREIPIDRPEPLGVDGVSRPSRNLTVRDSPSSLYCVQKSTSRSSPAARNWRMATSPALRPLLCAFANVIWSNSATPTADAPAAANPVFRKFRRL